MDTKNNDAGAEEEIVLTGEDNPEDIELEDAEERTQDKVKKTRDKLSQCEKEKIEILEELQRAKADFLNSKRRLSEQAQTDRERTLNSFLNSLLPLCDSFDMATADTAIWESIDENWRKGVEGIQNQLNAILKQHDVVVIEAKGEHFDPNRHEAMSAVDGDAESDTVLEVLQKGYERNGTVIRPAKVIIQN